MNFTFTFSEVEANALLNALSKSKAPFDEVAILIQKIQTGAQEQIKAKEKEAEQVKEAGK